VFPVRAGNHIRPLVDGGPAFSRIIEAVEAATASVWVTVAFIETTLELPGGRGSPFDVLDRAASRGLDVRVLFWDPDGPMLPIVKASTFPGTAESHDVLGDRSTVWQARWDRVGGQCQHQKSWVIDGGTETQMAFVGGINLGQGSVAWPDHSAREVHEREGNIHDLYVEARGPVAGDVAANFVERWNLASERDEPYGCWPAAATDDLETPSPTTAEAGTVAAQVTRSILPDLYELSGGENSVREQYLAAIDGARYWIHLENQILLSKAVLEALDRAIDRGVAVTALVPAEPMPVLRQAAAHPGIAAAFTALAALARHERFVLAAPAVNAGPGAYEEIYVHAKAALIDDGWATIGSTNLVFTSFQGDTEMNLSWWDPVSVAALRAELLTEHLGQETSTLGPAAAAERFGEVARANRYRRGRGEPLVGHAVEIDPTGWAR
jgi:phosphatidylserine/phosphatidylglycerophosphate/cardiolipin synthase-like enzyme